jgi:hypothetical protein
MPAKFVGVEPRRQQCQRVDVAEQSLDGCRRHATAGVGGVADILAEDWRIEYNTYRPHGSLDGLTPNACRDQWITNQNRLS